MSGLHRILLLPALLLGFAARTAAATDTCSVFNAQSRISAEGLNRELLIANSRLDAADLKAGRNPKLDAYMRQFAADAVVHGLQGRPEPAALDDVRAHYSNVMGAPSPERPDPDGGLKEDLHVVAGPMAAHRYHAALHVPGFPPDFAYYDTALPLRLRGQTIFDYGGAEGTIRERWSNHDNKFRTGQLWRYMLAHPRDADPARFRRDLLPGSDEPGALIGRDGDRLNAVFNGELALQAGDFTLVDGAFRYGPPSQPAGTERPITEAEGLAFVTRWFADESLNVDAVSAFEWVADDARLHGAGCDEESAADMTATVGGAGSGRLAARTLQRTMIDRLGPATHHRLLQSADGAAPFGELPVSTWSHVAFGSRFSGIRTVVDSAGTKRQVSAQYCAQWVMRLRAASPKEVRAVELWFNLAPPEDQAKDCADGYARGSVAAKGPT
jgi:hypothetical protein